MATNNKKITATGEPNVDFTTQPQATTAEEVNNQDSRTRLWQSLNYTYGQQRQQLDKSYDQAKLNADQQALSRGMQRSSYNNAVLANLDKQRADALDNNYSQQIADYQNRIGDIEAREQEQANWQAQFDANQAAQQWQQAFSEKQFQAQQEQWKQEFNYNQMTGKQQMAYNYLMNMLESGDNPSDALLAQAGISRSDYEQMKAAAVKSGGGGRGGKSGKTTTPAAGITPDAQSNFLTSLGNWFQNNQNTAATTNTTPAATSTTVNRGSDVTVMSNGKLANKLAANKRPVATQK